MIPLFLHLPKTGGTSFNHVIFDEYLSGESEAAGFEDPYFKGGIYYYPTGFFAGQDPPDPDEVRANLARGDLRAVVGHFGFGIHRYLQEGADYRYLTIVRRPVERIASLYRHVVHFADPDPELHRQVTESGMSLGEFASTVSLPELENDQTRRIAGVSGPCTRADLELAKARLREDFTFVGLTERFDEGLVLLKRKLDWRKPLQYYPENVSADWGRPAETPGEETVAAIHARNALDLELYALAEELFFKAREGALEDGFEEEVAAFRAHNRKMNLEWRRSIAQEKE